MHVRRFDNYESGLSERECNVDVFPRNVALESLLSSRTFNKADFVGAQLRFKSSFTAVDIIRAATNSFSQKSCTLAREIESHIDLESDCFVKQDTPSVKRRKRNTPEAPRNVFDRLIERYFSIVAGALTIVIERATNDMLLDAVEAILAFVSFVDTLKLSLVQPLLLTYPFSSHVRLQQEDEGVSASFHCLLGHSIPSVLMFSNTSTVTALERWISADCLKRAFHCYWSCLRSNTEQFAQVISHSTELSGESKRAYSDLLQVAACGMANEVDRLSLPLLGGTDLCDENCTDLPDLRYISSGTSVSLNDVSPKSDSSPFPSLQDLPLPISLSTVCYSLQGREASVNLKTIAREQEQRKIFRTPDRWSLTSKSWGQIFRRQASCSL